MSRLVLHYRVQVKLMSQISIDECDHWWWAGSKCRGRYPRFRFRSKRLGVDIDIRVHRLLWRMAYGDIVEGLQLRSTCGEASCVNPLHRRLSVT